MATEKQTNFADERKRLAERLKQYHDWNFTPGVYDHSIFGLAAKLLEVDAVPVVRCKDCVEYIANDGYCFINGIYMQPCDFCSYGRKED